MTTKAKKHNPAKAKLIQQSAQAKQIIKKRIAEAETDSQALAAACLKVNDILLEMHMNESGAKTFKTFKQWLDDGYAVKKGEKSYRVWGTPRRAKNEIEVTEIKTGKEKTVEEQYEFFPMCSLFNENQVEPVSDEKAA